MDSKKVFVFGSNLAGMHGGGAARCAHEEHGAEMGVGEGPTGNSYALPTMDEQLAPRSLDAIRKSVGYFLVFADRYPTKGFFVTRVGCGIAGFKDEQIGPMFKGAPENCELPKEWEQYR